MNKLKKNDNVLVTTGKDKGKQGQVRRVMPKEGRALVTGVNIVKKHQRPRTAQQVGGIIEMEAAIQIANLMVVCPNCGEAARLGIHIHEGGKKVRFCKKCKEDIE
ncbi:MAG: 50S ribosomal protein L24 [Chloroflexi bacterium]|nr:50S ribosomal protein L24 [Chloroflexota bacterium]